MAVRLCSRRKNKKSSEEEKERIRQQILTHADTLADEMNLRLLLWDTIDPGSLFVECVTVTAIVFPERKVGLFNRMKKALGWLLHGLRALLPVKSGNRPITNK